MSKPDFDCPAPRVSRELLRADRLDRAGQWTDADQCYCNAVDLDRSPASRIAYGSSLAMREQFNAAICQLTGALEIASTTGNREALGVIYHNLAAIYREVGDADLARRFQQRALLELDDCGTFELLGLANDAWLSRRAELAECLASSYSDDDDDNDAPVTEARATVAVISGLSDDPRAGIRSLIAACRKHQQAGAQRFMGIDLLNLSVLLSDVGWHRAAIQFVDRAIHRFEQASAPVSAARARQILKVLRRVQSLREFDPSVN